MRRSRYTRLDLEPLSFDDLPLGGEWTTRRRTISESDIALFSGVAGDFSPLTIEAAHGHPRTAPPALLVAIAVGLGSIDMPVPSVAEWEWLNWKFPRPVHAGDTIYARWTLTQKRPPVGGSATSIVVWRVDVHAADGALCAEGEVGAKVRRSTAVDRHKPPGPAEPAAVATSSALRRRRRRRPASGNGTPVETPAIPAPPPSATKPEKPATARAALAPAGAGRAPGTPAARRRRRRRPSGTSAGSRDGAEPAPGPVPASASEPTPAPASRAAAAERGTLSRVIRRLRRT